MASNQHPQDAVGSGTSVTSNNAAPQSFGTSNSAAPQSSGTSESAALQSSGTSNSEAPQSSGTSNSEAPQSSETSNSAAPQSSGTSNSEAPQSSGTSNSEAPQSSGISNSAAPQSLGTSNSAAPQSSEASESAASQSSGTSNSAAPHSSGTSNSEASQSSGTFNSAAPQSSGTSNSEAPQSSGTSNSAAPQSSGTSNSAAPQSSGTSNSEAPQSSGTSNSAAPQSSGTSNSAAPESSGTSKSAASKSSGTSNIKVQLGHQQSANAGQELSKAPGVSPDGLEAAPQLKPKVDPVVKSNDDAKSSQNAKIRKSSQKTKKKTKNGEKTETKTEKPNIAANIVGESDGPPQNLAGDETKAEKPPEQKILDEVYEGHCPFDLLPPLMKKVVRIFVSSTFSDTKEERNAFMKNVYPAISELCRVQYGLEFQVVDMRWGVPEYASDHHTTAELCLQEIRKCQTVSVGPNFVALLGDKYGYRPIPSTIPEEEFKIMAGVASEGSSPEWSLVHEWFQRDENAVPAEYVLLPISTKIEHYNNATNDEPKKQANNKWNETYRGLTSTVRSVAKKARESGKLSADNAHKYFMSVTENEVTQGILNQKTKPQESCVCIIRNIPDIDSHLEENQAPRFIDLQPGQNSVDDEAQHLLKELRERKLAAKVPLSNLTMVDISWSTSGAKVSLEAVETGQQTTTDDTVLNKHKEYLENICKELFEKLTSLINSAGLKQGLVYDTLTTEVLHQVHFAKIRCEVFEGREEILGEIKQYLHGESTLPLTVFGNSGCGKTSVMAKVLELIPQWNTSQGRPVIVSRFLGTSSMSSSLKQLLSSMCQQLANIFNENWEEPDRFSDLVASFHALLAACAKRRQIILVIDSVDQLMPTYNAFRMDWLPHELQVGVKLVVSTIDEGYTILDRLREKYQTSNSIFIEVPSLGEKVGLQIMNKWLLKVNRRLTEDQQVVILKAFEKCSLPLFARITFDQIRKWRSFITPTLDQLQVTVKGAIEKLFQQLESKFGLHLVKHSLAYLSGSRFGLSEVELEHILSLDDALLNKVYTYWRPPMRRVPPLLWTRLRSEINSYIVERSVDDVLVLYWYHRQFITASKQRYLNDTDFATSIHTNMAEYFIGKWSGKCKPFSYTASQQKRFGLAKCQAAADRKVPSQPYMFETGSGGQVRANKRKISELPFQLLKAKQHNALRLQTFFSYEWLYAKLKSSSPSSVLEELELFMQAEKSLRTDDNVKVLYATLQLIRPYLARFPNSLSLELTARLAKHVGKLPYLTSLVKQCDEFGVKHCPLIPIYTCFESADLALKQNITFRATSSWVDGRTFALSKDFRTMYIIDYDEQGHGMIQTWDVEAGEKIQEVPIAKQKDSSAYDLHTQVILDNREKHLIAVYREKYYGLHKDRTIDTGKVDVIRIEDGTVIRTIEGRLSKQPFFNPISYVTDNWISVRFGWKIHLYHLLEEKRVDLSRPHRLTHDEQRFALLRSKKAQVRYFVGEESTNAAARSSQVCLRMFDSKEDIAELDGSESAEAIATSADDSAMFVAAREFGTVNIYDISKARAGSCKAIKPFKILKLPRNEKVKVAADLEESRKNARPNELDVEDIEEFEKKCKDKPVCRAALSLSPNEQYLIANYSNTVAWEAFLWNVGTGNFVCRVAPESPLVGRYPAFSADSQYVIMARHTVVDVISCKDAMSVTKYEIGQPIRDISASKESNQVAVMRGNDVVFLHIGKQAESGPAKGTRQQKTGSQLANVKCKTLLFRERLTNLSVHKELVLAQKDGVVEVDEVGDAILGANTDVLTSARSQRRFVLDSWVSPDGLKLVQLHSRVQVVDTVQEDIKYTPRKGETISRTGAAYAVGHMETTTLEIPGLNGGQRSAVLDLLPGDRIVNETNKVKFRAPSPAGNKLSIMNVPSTLTSFDITNGKLQKLSRITVYQETVITLSDLFLVTYKKKSAGQFINIYAPRDGKLIATHPLKGECASAQLSADDTKLLIVDKDVTLHVFSGENFIKGDQVMALFPHDKKQTYHVHKILLFPLNTERIMVRFNPEGAQGTSSNIHVCFNVRTMDKSKAMVVNPTFEDVSKDGSCGIDANLNIYDLEKGAKIGKLPYSNTSENMQVRVQLSDDNRHVVIVDGNDDTLHVFARADGSAKEITACFTHAPKLPLVDGFTLRHNGSVVQIRGSKTLLFLLPNTDSKIPRVIDYSSEFQRAISLVEPQS